MTLPRLRTRRHLLRDIGLAGAAGALGWRPRAADAEPPPETTTVRLLDHPVHALQMLRELPYGRWRQYDAEDTLRFYALRLHEAGLIRSNPRTVIAQGADWRFFRDLRRELKG